MCALCRSSRITFIAPIHFPPPDISCRRRFRRSRTFGRTSRPGVSSTPPSRSSPPSKVTNSGRPQGLRGSGAHVRGRAASSPAPANAGLATSAVLPTRSPRVKRREGGATATPVAGKKTRARTLPPLPRSRGKINPYLAGGRGGGGGSAGAAAKEDK